MIPNNSYGRAHFYSPVKKVGKSYYITLYFNTLIIWIITLIVYLSLILDVLNKLKKNKVSIYVNRLKTKIFQKQ